MGIFDFLKRDRGAKPDAGGNTSVAKGLNLQSDDERAAARQRMEDEMSANRADREAAAKED
ncbi:MAG: hypothetical protein AB7F65_11765 [Dehalococcoidia bacterium]